MKFLGRSCPLNSTKPRTVLLCIALVGMPFANETPLMEVQQVQQVELEWMRAIYSHDVAKLADLLPDDLFISIDNEVGGKANLVDIASLTDGLQMQPFIEENTVRVYGDAAVSIGVVKEKSSGSQDAEGNAWRYTNTYLRREGRWRPVSILAARVAVKAGRAGHAPDTVSEIALDPDVATVRSVGRLEFPSAIGGRDGGYSARFHGRSVWIFSDTPLRSEAEDGSRWRSSTWTATQDFDASDGLSGFLEPLDRNGAPAEFLPFTDAEAAYNALHGAPSVPDRDWSRYALWTGPLVVDPVTGRGLVFYTKVFAKRGQWAFEHIGWSIALWDSTLDVPQRPLVRPGTDEPTILFPKGEPEFGRAAMADGGWLYAYGCIRKEDGSWPCVLGRVRFGNALQRDKWRFFAGGKRWTRRWQDAAVVMRGSANMSVHRNNYLHKYIAVLGTGIENVISIRSAERPEGPWSESRRIVKGVPPTEGWLYCTYGHPELARAGGRVEYISYYRQTGFFNGEIRLVEVTFK